ncbi:hypothetical protein [uncultured Parabacteroides sp.]|uniref:hypothetical protein n=1 Tax=uncultured Parabacteroides sp. TaxID=512312 RepID=UPI0026DD417E|nr:hypothetical protein [uncultured Parabacteroides sp.]
MEREPSLATLPAGERVRLLATAYNFSFTAPLGELRLRQSRKTFHLDLLPSRKVPEDFPPRPPAKPENCLLRVCRDSGGVVRGYGYKPD